MAEGASARPGGGGPGAATGAAAQRWSPLVALLLLAAGLLGWWLALRPALRVDAAPLEALPLQLGAWRAEAIPLGSAVESMLATDASVHRAYHHPGGDVVWVYVGYYGTTRGGRPEHLPRVCYEAQGWEVAQRRRLELDPERGRRANEYVVRREGHERLVQFWYRSHRQSGLVSGLGLSWDHLLGRVQDARADGALVRVSTPLEGDLVATRSRLAGFAAALDRQLDGHWPRELARRSDG